LGGGMGVRNWGMGEKCFAPTKSICLNLDGAWWGQLF